MSQIYEDVNDASSEIGSVFHLDTAAQENGIFTLQNDIQMKCKVPEVMRAFYKQSSYKNTGLYLSEKSVPHATAMCHKKKMNET